MFLCLQKLDMGGDDDDDDIDEDEDDIAIKGMICSSSSP